MFCLVVSSCLQRVGLVSYRTEEGCHRRDVGLLAADAGHPVDDVRSSVCSYLVSDPETEKRAKERERERERERACEPYLVLFV